MSLWSSKWISWPRGSFNVMIYTSSIFLHAWISQGHYLYCHRPSICMSLCGKWSCLLDRVRVLLNLSFFFLICLGFFSPPQRNNQLFPYLCEISCKNIFCVDALYDPLERAGTIVPGTGRSVHLSTICHSAVKPDQATRYNN